MQESQHNPPVLASFHGVTKLYRTVIGVNDLTLELSPGAHGLLGPNGSGKTTFINLITGQLRPTLGRVEVFGRTPWNHTAVLGRIGLCPAMDVLHRTVTGLQWVRYLMEVQGFTPREAQERAILALQKVGLEHAMKREIGGYSRGMKQRAKLAQAIAHEPEFLILDEPFNGLDPVGRHEMTELLDDWIRSGKSLLLASHILHEVEAICRSFMLICNGRVLASGTAPEVHSMLADIPSDITIRCDKPKEFARHVLSEAAIQTVTLDDQKVVLSSQNPLHVFERLPAWCAESEVIVYEISSSDENLQELFHALMRIHRGEIS